MTTARRTGSGPTANDPAPPRDALGARLGHGGLFSCGGLRGLCRPVRAPLLDQPIDVDKTDLYLRAGWRAEPFCYPFVELCYGIAYPLLGWQRADGISQPLDLFAQ